MFCLCTVAIVLIVAYYVIDYGLRSLRIGKVTDKYVFITGCDSGFGKLAALRIDQLGYRVFAACLTQDGVKALSESCSSRVTPLLLDVSNDQSIKQAVQLAQEQLQSDTGLWALLNNAGVAGLLACPSEFCRREDFLNTLNVNLLGAMELTRQFLPLLRKGHGRVVNVSSVFGRLAVYAAPYGISKFGMECYSDILRREVSRQGIKVSIVEPGAFKTSVLSDKVLNDCFEAFDRSSPEILAIYGGGANIKAQAKEGMSRVLSSMNPDLNPVVDAYIHAINSRFPRTRYLVGRDAYLYYIPLSFLPDIIADYIIAWTI